MLFFFILKQSKLVTIKQRQNINFNLNYIEFEMMDSAFKIFFYFMLYCNVHFVKKLKVNIIEIKVTTKFLK